MSNEHAQNKRYNIGESIDAESDVIERIVADQIVF